ncbi:MAG TPA: ABC transporter substrate-binding protein [Trueperaceae bacterium]|nr:ABC transporter substrate-binding protein [Trueperaceae bacterium]
MRHLKQLLVLATLSLTAAVLAQPQSQTHEATAEGRWEMRVCAPPQSLPFSDDNEAGYENRIASLVAEQLGAELTYEWVAFTEDLVNLHFAEGTCDVLVGIPDGFRQGLNTIAYYQSPYVMVYAADSGIDIDSLDDPDLAELRIGVQGAGTPPQVGLLKRGLSGNVHRVYGGTAGSDERLGILVSGIESGEIDIGFGWGPAVQYFADRSPTPMVVRPVTPEFEPPSIFQSVPMTMAVRRNDLALRDMLNQAIAARWEDIQAVLDEYEVPRTPIPAAFAGSAAPPSAEVMLRVGVILPSFTGGRTLEAAINDIIGDAAMQGALVAEGLINTAADTSGTDVVLLSASAPSPAAAQRAAERLVAASAIDALVGGVGAGQAEVVARVADTNGLPFLNVGSSDELFRRQCLPTTFHIEPSAGAYFSAMFEVHQPPVGPGPTGWYVVYLDDPAGHEMLGRARDAMAARGNVLVGESGVDQLLPSYYHLFPAIAAAGADGVMVILPPAEQLTFMGQYLDAGGTALLAPYPDAVTQTRNFLAATTEYEVDLDHPRVVAWDTTLADGRAGSLNQRFTSRFGQPLDPTAWTTYEALMILWQAATAMGSSDPAALVSHLAAPDSTFETAKGTLAFSDGHELAQQLYAVVPVADAWGVNLSQKLAAATLHRTLPAALLDASSVCDFSREAAVRRTRD